jgi:hypothetical protein
MEPLSYGSGPFELTPSGWARQATADIILLSFTLFCWLFSEINRGIRIDGK